MRSRKGFTLIELLAVIVILAVIALIATPIIMNVINDSKEGAAKDAMYGYVKAVELAGAKQISPTTDAPDGDYTTENGNLKKGSEVLEITFKGTKPANNGTVTLSKGSVVKATLIFDGITVHYNGKKAEVGDSGSSTPTPTPEIEYNVGDVIYYNPETNTKCNVSEVNTTETAKTGCLKWNVVKKQTTTYDLMLNHNTTKNIAWNSSGDNKQGIKEVATALANDTQSWESTVKNTVRLITGEELATIVKNTSWTSKETQSISLSAEPWIYQNLSDGNTNAQPYGYWTNSANSLYAAYAWSVGYGGTLHGNYVTNAGICGVRPVVTIAGSIIQ